MCLPDMSLSLADALVHDDRRYGNAICPALGQIGDWNGALLSVILTRKTQRPPGYAALYEGGRR